MDSEKSSQAGAAPSKDLALKRYRVILSLQTRPGSDMIKVVQTTVGSAICLQVPIWSGGERADSKEKNEGIHEQQGLTMKNNLIGFVRGEIPHRQYQGFKYHD